MTKEAKKLDGSGIIVHKDLVSKVDHYTRDHLKNYKC